MKRACLPFTLILCASCVSHTPMQTTKGGVTIIHLTQPPSPSPSPPLTYRVRKGDTLFDIARSFGLDHHELARINDIGANDIIVPGQLLRLRDSAPFPARGKVLPPGTEKKEVQTPELSWIWPVDTRKELKYSQTANRKGIDIRAARDSYVLAAAAGQVVYAGEELEEYGRLVLISHHKKFLSVYANSQEFLVREGQRVEQGERIARMGTKENMAYLYFEIRHEGISLDPLSLLPEL